MNGNKRRELIIKKLIDAATPLSASKLANEFSVSRQVIVGDIAILRASGSKISATPRGYILDAVETKYGFTGILPCKHGPEDLLKELYIIVDFGATVIDVIVDHPVYGQLSGNLNISSRYDVDLFAKKAEDSSAKPLSVLSDGIHLHTIGCKDEEIFEKIKEKLTEENILI